MNRLQTAFKLDSRHYHKVDLKRLAGMDPDMPPAGASVYRPGVTTTSGGGGGGGGKGGGDAVRSVRRAQAAGSGFDSLGIALSTAGKGGSAPTAAGVPSQLERVVLDVMRGVLIYGRAVQVDPMKPKLKPPGIKRLKLNCDILLSNSTCAATLRRCGGPLVGRAVQVDPRLTPA